MHVTHVKVTQTKQAVKCAGTFFFLYFSPDARGPAASWRLLCDSGALVCPPRRLFQASDVLLDFFELSCRDKANRCLYLLRLRGRFRRKKLHHNQPLQILLFTLPPKPLTSAAGAHRQESGAFIHLLILIMDHF